jgi:uncharacterized alkaline shock family protein YloU
MSTERDDKASINKIPDDVIAICAANATLKTSGVADLSSGFSDTLSKNLLGRDPLCTGIKVVQNEDGITLDVYVLVKFGAKIPEVSWDIQEHVRKSVTEITDLNVKAVNIHVQGVVAVEEEG